MIIVDFACPDRLTGKYRNYNARNARNDDNKNTMNPLLAHNSDRYGV